MLFVAVVSIHSLPDVECSSILHSQETLSYYCCHCSSIQYYCCCCRESTVTSLGSKAGTNFLVAWMMKMVECSRLACMNLHHDAGLLAIQWPASWVTRFADDLTHLDIELLPLWWLVSWVTPCFFDDPVALRSSVTWLKDKGTVAGTCSAHIIHVLHKK